MSQRKDTTNEATIDYTVVTTIELIKTYLPNVNEISISENVENYFSYPKNIILTQDCSLKIYYQNLYALLSANNHSSNTSAFIRWQYIQVYRILNTMLGSHKISQEHKILIKAYRDELKKTEILSKYLNELAQKKQDLVFIGHSSMLEEDGFIDFENKCPETTAVLYTGVGAEITESLSLLIENDVYVKRQAVIENKHGCILYCAKSDFPIEINAKSQFKLPDFRVYKEPDLIPRLIEPSTGRTVYWIKDKVRISKIFALFPGHTIHLATCAKYFEYDHDMKVWNKIGPYKNLLFTKYQEYKKDRIHPSLSFYATYERLWLKENHENELPSQSKKQKLQ